MNDRTFGGNSYLHDLVPKILGEGWVSHHGKHKYEGARGVIESANANHSILNGVEDVFGPTDVYGIRALTAKDTILLRGQVTENLKPDSKPVASKMTPCNLSPGYILTPLRVEIMALPSARPWEVP